MIANEWWATNRLNRMFAKSYRNNHCHVTRPHLKKRKHSTQLIQSDFSFSKAFLFLPIYSASGFDIPGSFVSLCGANLHTPATAIPKEVGVIPQTRVSAPFGANGPVVCAGHEHAFVLTTRPRCLPFY